MYSEKLVTRLVGIYKNETTLDWDDIRRSIRMFHDIKESNQIVNKDITTYSWDNLRDILLSYKKKRIRSGVSSDDDPNLIYNENNMRVYYAPDVKSAIRYGEGYTFCISSRGKDNAFKQYSYNNKNSIYFIFNDHYNKRKKSNKQFQFPQHLTVVLVNENPAVGVSLWSADNTPINNKDAWNKFKPFEDILIYRGLDNMEQSMFNLDIIYNIKISNLSMQYHTTRMVSDMDGARNIVDKYSKNDASVVFGFSFDPKDISYFHIISKSNRPYMIPMKKVLFSDNTMGGNKMKKNLKMVHTHIMDENTLTEYMEKLNKIVNQYKDTKLVFTLNLRDN